MNTTTPNKSSKPFKLVTPTITKLTWKCPKCHLTNSNNYTTCAICDDRSKSPLHTSRVEDSNILNTSNNNRIDDVTMKSSHKSTNAHFQNTENKRNNDYVNDDSGKPLNVFNFPSQGNKWKCEVCLVSNDMSIIQCAACEAYRPGLDPKEIEDEKKKLTRKFESTMKPTGFSFGGEATSTSNGFSFGADVSKTSTSTSSGFSFGADATSTSGDFSFGADATSTNTTTTSGFSFGADALNTGTSVTTQINSNSKLPVSRPNPYVYSPVAPSPRTVKNTLLTKQEVKTEESTKLSINVQYDKSIFNHTLTYCDVFVHGSGECDQLGLGEGVYERKKPTLVKFFLKIPIIKISVGAMHTIALSNAGLCYSWGCNDDGALGRFTSVADGPNYSENTPGIIDGLFGFKIEHISAGDSHTAFLSDKSMVFLSGSFKDSSGHIGSPQWYCENKVVEDGDNGLYIGTESIHEDPIIHKHITPIPISPLITSSRNRKISGIASGANHILFQCPFGVYSLGNDEFGQLGSNDKFDSSCFSRRTDEWKLLKLLNPKLVYKNSKNLSVKSIHTGTNSSWLILSNDEVLGCGLNNFQQLLQEDDKIENINKFVKIDKLSFKNIQSISGGSFHFCAVSRQSLFVWGRSDYSCGTEDFKEIKISDKFNEKSNIRAHCGSYHTLSSISGNLFSWGFGENNQLGNNPRSIIDKVLNVEDDVDEILPYSVDSAKLNERYVIDARGGAQHSVEIAIKEDMDIVGEECIFNPTKIKTLKKVLNFEMLFEKGEDCIDYNGVSLKKSPFIYRLKCGDIASWFHRYEEDSRKRKKIGPIYKKVCF